VILPLLDSGIAAIRAVPVARLRLYAGVILIGLIYLGWSLWGNKPQSPAQGFVAARPAIKTAKVQGPTVAIKVVPREAVLKTFPTADIPEPLVVVETADIPQAPNGATAIVTMDPQTGETETIVQNNEAPWFALERGNTIGAGLRIGTQGQRIPVYYRRDLLRIKDVHLVGEVGGSIALDPREKSEAHATGMLEYRF
jgi:hypothetical protein